MIDLAKFKILEYPDDTKVKAEVGDAITWMTMSDHYVGRVSEVSSRRCIVDFPNSQYSLPRTWSSFGHVKNVSITFTCLKLKPTYKSCTTCYNTATTGK